MKYISATNTEDLKHFDIFVRVGVAHSFPYWHDFLAIEGFVVNSPLEKERIVNGALKSLVKKFRPHFEIAFDRLWKKPYPKKEVECEPFVWHKL